MDQFFLAAIKTTTRFLLAVAAGSFLYAVLPDVDEARAIALSAASFVVAMLSFWLELYLERKHIER